MKRKQIYVCHALLTVALFLCLVGSTAPAGVDEPARVENSARDNAFIQDHPARDLYLNNCAGCHGQYLQGGSASSFLDGKWAFGFRQWEVQRSIRHGISGYGMPSFGESLSPAQVDSLVDYITGAPADLGVTAPAAPEQIQTRDYDVRVETVVDSGLTEPWAIAFIDEDRALVTDKPGQLYWLIKGKLNPTPVQDTPRVRYAGQGGLLDVNIDPQYGDGQNDWVYLSYSHQLSGGDDGPGMTRIVRGRIVDNRWTDEQTLFEARDKDYLGARHHYGSRIVFDHDGNLLFSIGDRGNRPDAQNLNKPNGKVHRIARDGSIPTGNPFVGRGSKVYDSIYTLGHRNIQGMAVHPDTGALWVTEHGPMGGDELNLIEPGKNYGWPTVTYGINYNGTIITDQTHGEGLEQPTTYWTPSIAVCGLDVYDQGPFTRWRGNLFAGALAHEEVRRIVIEGDKVIHQELILKSAGRVRDVSCAPDGSIYVLLNKPGRILRLSYLNRALRQ